MHQVHENDLKLKNNFKDFMISSHIEFIYDKYKTVLTGFLELELPDIEKKKYFRYFANEFEDELKNNIFK